MTDLRIESIEPRLFEPGEVATLALALLARAQMMGFLPPRDGQRVDLDRAYLDELAELLRRDGVATVAASDLQRVVRAASVDAADLARALRATLAAVDGTPRPHAEWAPIREVVGDELLGRLLRISVSSLRRYAGGERTTPDAVAWRLHAVARVVAALIGSYNGYGVRRWFERRRVTLDGAAPAEVFVQVESEDDERLQRVLGLADELTGAASAA